MKVMNYKYIILVISMVAVTFFGCSLQQSTSEKQSRLVAAENIELQNNLEQRNLEIARLKQAYDQELEEQIQLLTDLQKQVKALREKSKQNLRSQVQGVVDTIIEENAKFRKENEELKSRIESLESKIEQLEKMLKETKS